MQLALLLLTVLFGWIAEAKMLIGYFPNWLYANYPVEQIPYDKYTHINYAFAVLNTPDLLPSFTDDWAVQSGLPKLVTMAHDAGTKVLLSIGGWTGSMRFSSMVASPESRKNFIDWNMDFIRDYETDGVDIDWEYPGRQAAGCNEVASEDVTNFRLLLQELREALDTNFPDNHKEISLAVHVEPFRTDDHPALKDVSDFVPFFDHINLMTYDINGAWAEQTGPNAPFVSEEGKGAPYSFVESIQQWKAAGVPAEKMTAGVAFYGRSMQLAGTQEAVSQYMDAKVGAPKGDSDDAYWADPYCSADIDGLSGVWKWTNLRSEGVLLDDYTKAGSGWERHWDDVTKTPYLINTETNVLVSYDDPASLATKVDYALCEDIGGLMVWDIHQDNGELLDVVKNIRTGTCANGKTASSLENASQAVPAVGAASSASSASYPDASAAPIRPSSSAVPTAASDSVSASVDSSSSFMITSRLLAPSASSSNVAASSSLGSAAFSLAGATCSAAGENQCVDSGASAEYLTCVYGEWISRKCSPGTVCHDDAGPMRCDLA
ncbi:glycosyl hydrolases family 18-domain-containing protein [Syncephalastrum racemosum]|uniref:Glycosyl hydrolases family 18-domain-containing protein n=1 Tax=Syncephalastrum racemosum TaxID=13706 RepID=A0A1X2HCY8_SYNRA|nr:glycosyl hydrolases family 18-domain-containing protein [Syncephalastrum racemosum]